jgi:hypothetical protein
LVIVICSSVIEAAGDRHEKTSQDQHRTGRLGHVEIGERAAVARDTYGGLAIVRSPSLIIVLPDARRVIAGERLETAEVVAPDDVIRGIDASVGIIVARSR